MVGERMVSLQNAAENIKFRATHFGKKKPLPQEEATPQEDAAPTPEATEISLSEGQMVSTKRVLRILHENADIFAGVELQVYVTSNSPTPPMRTDEDTSAISKNAAGLIIVPNPSYNDPGMRRDVAKVARGLLDRHLNTHPLYATIFDPSSQPDPGEGISLSELAIAAMRRSITPAERYNFLFPKKGNTSRAFHAVGVKQEEDGLNLFIANFGPRLMKSFQPNVLIDTISPLLQMSKGHEPQLIGRPTSSHDRY
jgi:hypothetical protein